MLREAYPAVGWPSSKVVVCRAGIGSNHVSSVWQAAVNFTEQHIVQIPGRVSAVACPPAKKTGSN